MMTNSWWTNAKSYLSFEACYIKICKWCHGKTKHGFMKWMAWCVIVWCFIRQNFMVLLLRKKQKHVRRERECLIFLSPIMKQEHVWLFWVIFMKSTYFISFSEFGLKGILSKSQILKMTTCVGYKATLSQSYLRLKPTKHVVKMSIVRK